MEASHCLVYRIAERQDEVVNTEFCSIWFVSTENRIRVYRFALNQTWEVEI